MERRVLALVGVMLFVFALVPAVGHAQQVVTANIDFPFVADGKTLPPGGYDLAESPDSSTFQLTPTGTGPSIFLLPVTRLAAPETPVTEARLVFDRVGNMDYLSEIWMPGQDGFLFHITKEKHTHHVVKAVKKVKK